MHIQFKSNLQLSNEHPQPNPHQDHGLQNHLAGSEMSVILSLMSRDKWLLHNTNTAQNTEQ